MTPPGDQTGVVAPIELDLSGAGIGITQLTSSNTFEAIDTDGYQHRTAWAAAGDAVLFVDPNGLNTIRDADQYIFTDWDPSANTDMEALRNVFDTNHDGVLDAGDAAFGQFKLMVTNADGTTTVETLAQAGITAIDLTQSSVTRSFADGSSVDGQSSFTRTDGSTGTVAAVTYAADAQGYAVRTTTTVNADGATTVDNRALNGDGSLNNDTSSTTSADGTTRTISYDTAGNGVVDRTQTVVDTVASGGARTETVSDHDGQDQLVDSTATTTAPDGSVFIRRDTTGGGITTQTETRKVLPSGDTGDTLADISADGTVIDSTFTQIGQNGLGRDVQVDHAGIGHYDHSTVSRTTVAADGTRTETIIGIDHDQSATNSDTIVTSPDAQTRTDSISFDGDTVEQVQVARTSYDAIGDVTTRTTTTDGDQSEVLGITATTVSGDGLSKTVQVDMDGDGTFDRTTSDDTTTNQNGGQTEDVTVTSADGTVLSEVLTARGTDGVSRDAVTLDGAGHILASDTIGVGPQGGTREDAYTAGIDGTVLAETVKLTASDGLTTTTQMDQSGDGTFDRVVTDQTIENGNGSATEIAGTRSANGTLLGRTVTETSADGLTVTTKVDATGTTNDDGTGVFDRTTTDSTSYATDGSRIRAVTVTAASGAVLSSVTTDTGAERQSHSVTTDANGDGYTTTLEQVSTAPNGTVTDDITDFNPDGTHVDEAVRTTTADGLSTTTQIDASGTGTFNRTTTDDTTIGDDGLRTETVVNTGHDGTVVGQTVTTSQSNGDLTTVSTDTAGTGSFDHVTRTATRHDAGGGTTVTVTDLSANGAVRDTTTTVTSGNGLATTVSRDLNGNGVADLTTASSMAYEANGAVTMTTTDTDAHGLRDETDTTVSDNGRTTLTNTSYDGSVHYSTSDAKTVGADGNRYDDALVHDHAGTLVRETLTTTTGNGLSTTVQVDVNGDGTFDTTMQDATTLDADGGRTETTTMSGSAGLNGETVVRTSGNGLSKTVRSDAAGNGTVDTVTQDDTTLNVDGTRLEITTQKNQDQSLRNSTTIGTSADGKHVTIARVLGSDGHQAETIDRGIDGTVTDVLSDVDGAGVALGAETVTTSANGLVKTATYTDAAGTQQDVQSDTRTLGPDGSTTEAFSDVDSNAGISAVFDVTTSGNGLTKTTTAQFSDLPFVDYSTLDTTTLNVDGTLNDTITTTGADGATRDRSVRTVSADGLTTTSSLDDNADGTAEITDTKVTGTDGSSVRTTTILNGTTGAQDRQDIVTTSADGRTLTLQSARDGDTTARYTETTVENPDGTISDKSQFVSGTLAPSWTQTRSQSFDTTGGQTVDVSDYDAGGNLADEASTTVSGNGLVVQSALDTTGDGTDDLIRTDATVIGTDGSRVDTITKDLAPGVAMSGPGTMGYGRVITTSADGLSVTTTTDDDGNGHSEKIETSVRGVDGSLVDTVTFHDNTTGASVMAQAADGSMSAGIVKTTSADGLVVTTTVGDITTQKTTVAGSNGSYRWIQNLNGLSAAPSASHSVDVNGVDTWTSSYIPDAKAGVGPNTTTTIQIDVAKEQAAVAQANAIYQTVLDRPMMDAEQEALIQYMQGGILDRQALATSLIGNSAELDLNLIQTSYENDFGHDASAGDTAASLHELQSGNRIQTRAEVVVDIAEKAVNEQAGNGLLALLPNAPKATAMTVTLISPETAAATDTGANYAAFANAIGKPTGNLTPGQISQFAALTGDTGAANAPQVNFASASSSTSGQGTAVPGFFGATPGATAKAPTGGAAGPLVVNLAGGKVHTTDLATSTVSFDDTGSGTAATTAWITADEGFLVLDPRGRQVTDGSAMIPTFAALAKYDSNGDGTLTAAEAASAGIKIWVDASADGIDQAGEVESLSQAGIAAINLNDATTGSYDHGNVIAADASVTFSNGTTGDVADAWLAYGGALTQGAVYQFGSDLVTRAADGTASELLYGTGQTIDAGAAGLARIVDAGSNDVLEAGTGAAVTLSGAAGDHLVGGSGIDTLLAIGDGETVKTGTGTGSVDVSGANTSVDASLGTSTISLDGANDSVTGATAATTVDVTKGTGARIAATGSKVTIEGGMGAEVSGSGVTVTAAGRSTIILDASASTLVSDAASTVTLDGSNDTLSLDRGSTVAVAGTGEVIGVIAGTLSLAANASARVTGNDDFATQAAGSSLTLVGTDDSVDVTGTGVVTALDRGSLVLENDASDTVTGTDDQVIQGQGTSLSLTGTNAALVVTGTGNQSNLSDARITIQGGASSTVTGSRDVITSGPTGLSGTLVGSDDRVTVSGTGAQVSVSGLRDTIGMDGGHLQMADDSSVTLTGSNDTVGLGAEDTLTATGQQNTLTAYGQDDTIVATGAGDIIGLQRTGDVVSASAAPIDLYGGITASVTGTGDSVYLDTFDVLDLGGSGHHVTVANVHDTVNDAGTGDTVSVFSTEAAVSIASGTVELGDGASATVTGSGDTIGLGARDALFLNGSNDVVTAYGENDVVSVIGAGNTVSLAASGATVAIGSGTVDFYYGITGSVVGSSDIIGLGADDSLTVSGSGNHVTAYDAGDTILDLARNDTISVLSTGATVAITAGIVGVGTGVSATVAGSNDTIGMGDDGSLSVTGSGNTITAYGTDDTIDDTGTGNAIVLQGTGDSVRASADHLDLYGNMGAQVQGSGNSIYLDTEDSLQLSGSANQVRIGGAYDTVTITGKGNSVSVGSINETVSIGSGTLDLDDDTSASIIGSSNSVGLGSGDAIRVNGSGNTVIAYGTNDTIDDAGTGNRIFLQGNGDNVTAASDNLDLYGNMGAQVQGSGNSVYLDTEDTLQLSGSANQVRIGGDYDTVTITGTGNSVSVGSTNDTVSIGAGTVGLDDNASASVLGDGDTVTLGKGDVVRAVGSGDTIVLTKTGDTVLLQGDGKGTGRVTAGSASVVQAPTGNLSVYGGLASTAVTASSSGPSIALGNGNTVSSSAVPATVDGYAANGLHSWEEIFNTMSGALKETDQYQYNASNSLMEIDRSNASNVKTEADLYDPKTSAEIGSYLYAANGHVNEVVDLLHNHDWLSQSNSTYRDKTSGAVSQTQPTLR